MIWLIFVILTLAMLLYLCAPLYNNAEPPVVGEDIDAYRAEAESVSPEDAVNFERQLLSRAQAKPIKAGVPRGWLGGVFLGGFALAALMYFSLGSPELARNDLPRAQPAMPSNAAGDIAQMSPEDRAAMIAAMVEGLAARLQDEPEDIEGWVRLLRSRQVLGQTDKARVEIILMRETFVDRSEVIKDILQRSGNSPQ